MASYSKVKTELLRGPSFALDTSNAPASSPDDGRPTLLAFELPTSLLKPTEEPLTHSEI